MLVALAFASLSAFLKMSILSVENVIGELIASKLVMGFLVCTHTEFQKVKQR